MSLDVPINISKYVIAFTEWKFSLEIVLLVITYNLVKLCFDIVGRVLGNFFKFAFVSKNCCHFAQVVMFVEDHEYRWLISSLNDNVFIVL